MRKEAPGRLLRAVSWTYLLLVIAILLTLRYVGERSWPVLIALYLPRWPLFAPLLLLVPPAIFCGDRRRDRRKLLLLHGAAALMVLFPLSGLRVPFSAAGKGEHSAWAPMTAQGKPIRIFSYNIWFGHRGTEAILREVRAADPDIVLFQATHSETDPVLQRSFREYHLHTSTEFLLASKYPIRDVHVPADVPDPSGKTPGIPASYVHYTLETPEGLIDLFNVHPFSPRNGFEQVRGPGLGVTLIESGWIPRDSDKEIGINTEIRRRQVQALSEEAARARHPVIIAGDTNLPGLSWIYHQYLEGFTDGFAQVGQGFGYTFPAHRLPWMRIDRILGGPGVRFLRFALGSRAGSDHVPVFADVELAP